MRRSAALAGLVLAATMASPAFATPDTFEAPIFSTFPDVEHGLVAFWNISRADYCAWADGGFQGDPPVTQPVTGRFNVLPEGPIVGAWAMTSNLELWTLDQDAALTGPCEDTDDSAAPWASGTALVSSTDNHVWFEEPASGVTRGRSFGDRGTGEVVDDAGSAHRYSWGFRAVEGPHGGYRERVHSELTP